MSDRSDRFAEVRIVIPTYSSIRSVRLNSIKTSRGNVIKCQSYMYTAAFTYYYDPAILQNKLTP